MHLVLLFWSVLNICLNEILLNSSGGWIKNKLHIYANESEQRPSVARGKRQEAFRGSLALPLFSHPHTHGSTTFNTPPETHTHKHTLNPNTPYTHLLHLTHTAQLAFGRNYIMFLDLKKKAI